MENTIAAMVNREFKLRQKARTHYSLRAFARDLGVSPGFLSDILKGEKNPSLNMGAQFAERMGWTTRETQLFLSLIQYSGAKHSTARRLILGDIKKVKKNLKKFDRMKTDQFSHIADWYHFAILELIDVKDFSPDPQWIGRRLNIPTETAKAAIERLARLGQVTRRPDGSLIKNSENSVNDTPSEAIRRFHLQHLKKAYRAVTEQSYEKRHLSGLTLAMSPEDLPKAEELIREFRSRMATLLENSKKTNVYHLAVQMFQLDRGESK